MQECGCALCQLVAAQSEKYCSLAFKSSRAHRHSVHTYSHCSFFASLFFPTIIPTRQSFNNTSSPSFSAAWKIQPKFLWHLNELLEVHIHCRIQDLQSYCEGFIGADPLGSVRFCYFVADLKGQACLNVFWNTVTWQSSAGHLLVWICGGLKDRVWGRNNKRACWNICAHLWSPTVDIKYFYVRFCVASSVILLKKTATHLHPQLQGNSCISDTSGNAPSVLKGRYRF